MCVVLKIKITTMADVGSATGGYLIMARVAALTVYQHQSLGYYYSNSFGMCKICPYETYLSGKKCCYGCEYLDMSANPPQCVSNGRGPAVSLTCTSLQRIWC